MNEFSSSDIEQERGKHVEWLRSNIADIYEYLLSVVSNKGASPSEHALLVSLDAARKGHKGELGSKMDATLAISRCQTYIGLIRSATNPEDTLSLQELSTTETTLVQVTNVFNLKLEPNKLSRRQFFVAMGVVTGVAAAAATGVPAVYNAFDNFTREPLYVDDTPEDDSSLEAMVRWFADTYGLGIETNIRVSEQLRMPPDAGHVYEKANETEIVAALRVLEREVKKYPTDYFTLNGITALTLVKNYRIGTFSAGGSFLRESRSIILDINIADRYLEESFHHELYHGADWNENGYDSDDEEWEGLHGCGCPIYPRETTSPIPASSYASDYGSSSAVEDRAEMAERMMTPSRHLRLRILIESQKGTEWGGILVAKYLKMKADYLRFSRGLIGEQYWEQMLKAEQQRVRML